MAAIYVRWILQGRMVLSTVPAPWYKDVERLLNLEGADAS